jgi:restriction endonuclease-like protein
MKYIDKIKQNLSKYKMKKFPDLEDGIWKTNKQKYSHILPEEKKYCNLLPIFRADLEKYIESQKVKLHTDFHHLNSSQAMCFNFFYPLFKERKLERITEFLGFKNEKVDYNTVCFEKDGLEVDFEKRPTSFDFYLQTNTGMKIYFEIKYTENDFGKAKIDKNHTDKYDEIYSKFLNPINVSFQSREMFLNNYQILRNLIHIDKDSFVVFLYPNGNLKIRQGAEKAKKVILKKDFKNNFFPIEWEQIHKKISSLITDIKLRKHFVDFKDKYLITK